MEFMARVERDRQNRDVLFSWLHGRAIDLDGVPGHLQHDCWAGAFYPRVELSWVADDQDLVLPLTWSERLDGIVRTFGATWCADCQRYCAPEIECPCCERLADERWHDEQDAPDPAAAAAN